MLKDKINVNYEINCLRIKCTFCKQFTHLPGKCFLFYGKFNKKDIIKKYQENNKQTKRQYCFRRLNKTKNPKLLKNLFSNDFFQNGDFYF